MSNSASKPKPCFSNLPWFLKDKIIDDVVDDADLIKRCGLRKLSKAFMAHIDPLVPHFDQITIKLGADLVRFIFHFNGNELLIKYRKGPFFKLRITNWHHVLGGPNHVQRAIRDILVFLKSSSVTVGMLSIGFDEFYRQTPSCIRDRQVFLEEFNSKLGLLPHKLHVTNLNIACTDEVDILYILPHLTPGTLEDIDIEVIASDKRLERVVQLEQWQQAKMVRCQGFSGIPVSAMVHLKRGVFTNQSYVLSLEEFRQLYQTLMANPTFQEFRANVAFNFDEFNTFVSQFPRRNRFYRDYRYIAIPNTNRSMGISIDKSFSGNTAISLWVEGRRGRRRR